MWLYVQYRKPCSQSMQPWICLLDRKALKYSVYACKHKSGNTRYNFFCPSFLSFFLPSVHFFFLCVFFFHSFFLYYLFTGNIVNTVKYWCGWYQNCNINRCGRNGSNSILVNVVIIFIIISDSGGGGCSCGGGGSSSSRGSGGGAAAAGRIQI